MSADLMNEEEYESNASEEERNSYTSTEHINFEHSQNQS